MDKVHLFRQNPVTMQKLVEPLNSKGKKRDLEENRSQISHRMAAVICLRKSKTKKPACSR